MSFEEICKRLHCLVALWGHPLEIGVKHYREEFGDEVSDRIMCLLTDPKGYFDSSHPQEADPPKVALYKWLWLIEPNLNFINSHDSR